MDDLEAMAAALKEARSAGDSGDIPVGAVVVIGDRIVAAARNRREADRDPTAHAEILALRAAAEFTGSWRLNGATLCVTLEPCVMCAGALVAARIGRLVFGAADLKAGGCGSLYNVCADPRLNHEVEVTSGVLANEAGDLLTSWFSARRHPDQ